MTDISEIQIIGSLLMDNDVIGKIADMLEPEMFNHSILRKIYAEYQRNYENNKATTLGMLQSAIVGDDCSEEVFLRVVKECGTQTYTTASVVQDAELVSRRYKADRANLILSRHKFTPETINDDLGTILSELEVLQKDSDTNSQTLSEIAKQYKSEYFTDNKKEKVKIGFTALDNCTSGLEGGDLIVLGARPAVGKSALAAQIALFLSENKKVAYFNLEMQSKLMYERFLSSASGIGLQRIRNAIAYLGDEKQRISEANAKLENNENLVIYTGSRTISQVRTEVRHCGFDVIIIDYLQLVRPDKHYSGNRYAEVGDISHSIKSLAMELNIPIIALSQLNRVNDETKEPTMNDLRESGDIEQDASIIMLMWNKTVAGAPKHIKGLKICKNRQGELKTIDLEFCGDMMKFTESDSVTYNAKPSDRYEAPQPAADWKPVDDDLPF